LLCDQKEVLRSLVEATEKQDETLAGDLWREIENLSASQASSRLDRPEDPKFLAIWEDLPPVYLLPGMMDLDEQYLRSLDAILIKKHLNSKIRTSLENMHQVEYQPVLELEAEWESPTGAALVSHAWAKTLIRTLREQYLDPTLELQSIVRSRFSEVENRIVEIRDRIQKIQEESQLSSLIREKENLLLSLYGNVERLAERNILPVSGEKQSEEPLVAATEDLAEDLDEILGTLRDTDSLLAQRGELEEELRVLEGLPDPSQEQTDRLNLLKNRIQTVVDRMRPLEGELTELHERIFETKAEVAAFEADLKVEELKRDYLIRRGAYESQNVNYSEMLGLRLMSPPTPARTPVSPVPWKIVLIAALAGFVGMCFLVLASHTLLILPPERFEWE
jgi:hypothetical protein